MSLDPNALNSRRAVLAAALGGGVAVIAQALGRPLPAKAEGQGIVVGGEYTNATSKTYIANNTNSDFVLAAQSTMGGTALHGRSDQIGIQGQSDGVGFPGLNGYAARGYGVAGVGHTGVYGRSLDDGPGVHADSVDGVALRVDGRIELSRSFYSAVAVGAKTVTGSTNGMKVTAATLVIAALETNQASLYLKNFVKDIPGNKIKFNISGNLLSGKYARVNWFLIS